MRTLEVDVAIIGGGTAGITARKSAIRHGARRVVVIEHGPLGTTCARVGCMPSKLLVTAAEAAHAVETAKTFGVRVSPANIDGPAVMRRVQSLRDVFVAGVTQDYESWPQEQRLTGTARFVAPDTLEVDDHTRVKATSIVIAVGSTPFVPPVLHGLGDRMVTTDDIFERDDLPASIAVVGTGAVGLELGQAMHRLNVRTTILSATRGLGPLRDPDLLEEAHRVFGAELDLSFDVEIESACRTDGGVELVWKNDDGETQRGEFELVLCAAGRRSNTAALDLEAAELELDDRGIPVHDSRTLQCGDRSIFIAGDSTGERAVLHEAADEGRHAGANAATWPEVRAYSRKTPLTIVFSDPQIAVVGRPGPRDEVEVACGEVDYRRQGRARVMGRSKGMVRVWGEVATGRLVGAEMLGPAVEHTAHLLAWAIQLDVTVGAALHLPYYHPVLEEGIRTAFSDLAAKLRLAPARGPLDCGPGD